MLGGSGASAGNAVIGWNAGQSLLSVRHGRFAVQTLELESAGWAPSDRPNILYYNSKRERGLC